VCTYYYVSQLDDFVFLFRRLAMAIANSSTTGGRRTRRSPQEVRGLLLGAARSAFASGGYAGTSTREIAEQAGVSEALLFRHFGTKANLFELAILKPFHEFIEDYVDQRPADLSDELPPPEVPSRDYVETLYDLLSKNRELIMALLAARAFEIDLTAKPELSDALDRLQNVVELEMSQRGLRDIDVPVAIRLTFAMVVAPAVFGDWLFPTAKRPPRKRIVDEMVQFMVHGLAHRATGRP
jgi:AcrR family transcriptional regulator